MHDGALPVDGTAATIETSRDGLLCPPDNARPGVYWYFMDGNQDRDEMVADLHAMVAAGIGTVLFLEVDVGIARGPIPFMSEEWQENVVHAFRTAADLGMQVLLGTGPGWAGSGDNYKYEKDNLNSLIDFHVGGLIPVYADDFGRLNLYIQAEYTMNKLFSKDLEMKYPTENTQNFNIQPAGLKMGLSYIINTGLMQK